MYIWNGYTVIGKHKDLTEGMLKTLDEAQAKLESGPSMHNFIFLLILICYIVDCIYFSCSTDADIIFLFERLSRITLTILQSD